jgi:hypothetical protein
MPGGSIDDLEVSEGAAPPNRTEPRIAANPLGIVPFDHTNRDQLGWAFETTMDVN